MGLSICRFGAWKTFMKSGLKALYLDVYSRSNKDVSEPNKKNWRIVMKIVKQTTKTTIEFNLRAPHQEQYDCIRIAYE